VLPAILGAPLVLIWLLRGHMPAILATQWGQAVRWILMGGYAALLIFFAVSASILGSAAAHKADYNKDVLIVLGCAVRGERISLTLKHRLDTAIEYLEHSPDTTVIVTGGLGEAASITEAAAMKGYLVAQGVEEGRIIMEENSTSTWENFKFTGEILDSRFPGASVAFVTTGFHIYRSARVARMHGIAAEGYAAPDVWYMAPNNYLREGLAVAGYKLRGMLI